MTTHMLDNWQWDYKIPDNTTLPCRCQDVDDIVCGSTPTHYFELPFDIESVVEELSITYKQSRTVLISKKLDDLSYMKNTVYCKLTAEETSKFLPIPNLLCEIQVRVKLKNNDILAADIRKVHVLPALDINSLMEE